MKTSTVNMKKNKEQKMTQEEKDILADKIEYYGIYIILSALIALMLSNIFLR